MALRHKWLEEAQAELNETVDYVFREFGERTAEECRSFKQLASEFSYYPNIDFLTRVGDMELKQNWEQLKIQNVSKANYICNGVNVYAPLDRESISQKQILNNQINKFESQPECRVSVLSSFPLLMYDWLGR